MTTTKALFTTLIGGLALLAGCASRGPAVSQMPPDSLLELGLQKLAERDWDDAIEALQPFTIQYPSHARYQEARLRLADAFLGKKEYISAAADYVRLAADFPSGEYADDARFGVCAAYAALSPRPQLDQQYTEAALDHCQALANVFPDSPFTPGAAELAQEMRDKLAEKMYRTGDYYFKLRAYDSAVQYLDDTLELYPGAAVVPRVLLRLYQAYQALGYSDEAQGARERLLRDFPSSEEAARIRSVDGDA